MSDQYLARLVGGQNLAKTRPLLTQNDKIFIPSDNTILGFSLKSGKLNQAIQLNENHTFFRQKNVSICLHPIASDFQLFSFTKIGLILNWNYEDSTLIKEFNLNLNNLFDNYYELVWATIKNYFFDGSNRLIAYYAVKCQKANKNKFEFKIYATPLDDLELKQELITLKTFDLKRIAFGRNQNYLILIDKYEIYFIALRNGLKRNEYDEAKAIDSKKRYLFKDRLQIVCCNPLKDLIAYACKLYFERLINYFKYANY